MFYSLREPKRTRLWLRGQILRSGAQFRCILAVFWAPGGSFWPYFGPPHWGMRAPRGPKRVKIRPKINFQLSETGFGAIWENRFSTILDPFWPPSTPHLGYARSNLGWKWVNPVFWGVLGCQKVIFWTPALKWGVVPPSDPSQSFFRAIFLQRLGTEVGLVVDFALIWAFFKWFEGVLPT